MSTATLETTVAFPIGLHTGRRGRPSPQARAAHLRLVPAGPGADAAPAARRPARVLRITRRGRLALTSTAALVVALVLVSLMGLIGPAGATTSVVVQPGQTLSQIASEQFPGVPLSHAVTDIQRANKLSTTSIAVGQELVIPGR